MATLEDAMAHGDGVYVTDDDVYVTDDNAALRLENRCEHHDSVVVVGRWLKAEATIAAHAGSSQRYKEMLAK